jgi:membrane protein implicated in regulation of membrane protease activity
VTWLVGLTSLMLPWVAVPLACIGLVMGVRGSTTGWWLLAGGLGLLLADVLLTLFWARPASGRTDQPLLNRREAQVIGRTVRVVEAIAGGEGKVRVADSVWRARGPDCAAGNLVKVVAAEGNYLVVVADEERPAS